MATRTGDRTARQPVHRVGQIRRRQIGEMPCRLHRGQRSRFYGQSILADRLADGVGRRFGVNPRKRGAKLLQPMDIRIGDNRLAVGRGPPDCRAVEIDVPGIKGVQLDGVEQLRVLVDDSAERGRMQDRRRGGR